MRSIVFSCLASLLGMQIVGCGGGAKFEPQAAPPAGARATPDVALEAAPAAHAPFDLTPKSAEASTGKPAAAMDGAHTGTERRPVRQPELPSGILTAGSFDDNIYPQFFRSFVGKAGQNQHVGSIVDQLLGYRLEVYVKNAQGAPVANARVRVASPGDGKSVELVTRSDGRAVFLSSLDGAAPNAALTVTASFDSGPAVTQPVEMGADRVTLILPAANGSPPNNLDLTIVLDTTGSMRDELEFLKSEIKNIAASIGKRFPNVNIRYGLVCYKDEGMADPYVTRKLDLTPELEKFRAQLAPEQASGGGDLPEAMHKGLEDAAALSWRSADTARVLFLIADAPPHGKDARATLSHINSLRKKGVAIYPIFASCNNPDAVEATEVVMRAAAMVTGAQYLFLTNDSGVGDSHAEPHIPYYHVEKLNNLMVRVLAGELSGKRIDPEPGEIIRTVGQPPKRGRQD